MRALLIGLVLAAGVAFACDDGSDSGDGGALHAQEIVDGALLAMARAESYRVNLTFSDAPDDRLWQADFQAPRSYRTILRLPGLDTDGPAAFEVIYAGDTVYGRECEDVDAGCGPWDEQERPPFVTLGPSASYSPDWPLVGLELARDVEVVERGELIHVLGSVNQIRAVFENQRRILSEAGIATFGEVCSGSAEPVEAGSATVAVQPTAECRSLSFQEALAEQEPGLSFYDEHPATIDAWIGSEDALVRRISFTIPPDGEGHDATEFGVEYSLFGEIEIEAPQ